MQLCRRFAAQSVLAEALEARLTNGEEVKIEEHPTISSTLVRLASRLGIDRRAGKKADIMREDNNKESRPLRSQGLAALRAAIVGAIDFVGGRSSLLLRVLTVSVLLGTTTTLSAQQATIVVAPPRIEPFHSVDLTVTSPSLDLSTISAEQVEIKPMDGISPLGVDHFDHDLILHFSTERNIKLGLRQLILHSPGGIQVLASAVIEVVDVGGFCRVTRLAANSIRRLVPPTGSTRRTPSHSLSATNASDLAK